MMNTWSLVFVKGKDHSGRREQEIIAKPKDSRKVEFEVELPGVDARRIFPLLICESQAQLDDFEQVDVTAQELVLIIDGAAEFANRPHDHPGELRVLEERGDSVSPGILPAVTITTLSGQSRQWKPALLLSKSMPTWTKTTVHQNTPQQQLLLDRKPSIGWKAIYQIKTIS